MARKVDKETILSFVEEVNSYLPKILDSIDEYKRDRNSLESLEEAHRLFHTIKGAASMLGLSALSHIAYCAEEALEEVAAGQLEFNQQLIGLFVLTVCRIEGYFDGAESEDLDERSILGDAIIGFRRIKGLPESEDEEIMADLFSVASALGLRQTEATAPNRTEKPVIESKDLLEEISSDIMEPFLQEAEEHFQELARLLPELEQDSRNKELLQQIRRTVHTLKGAAGMVGFRSASRLAHRMEDLLDALYEEKLIAAPETIGLIFTTFYAIQDMVGSGSDEAAEGVEKLYEDYAELLEDSPAQDFSKRAVSGTLDDGGIVDFASFAAAAGKVNEDAVVSSKPSAAQYSPSQIVRVPIERLDELVRLVSELIVSRSAFEQYYGGMIREINELKLSVGRMQRIAGKLETDYETKTLGAGIAATAAAASSLSGFLSKPQIGGGYGFDELEFDRYTEFHLLARELSETTSDLNSVGNELGHTIGDFDGYLNEMSWLTSEVQDKLMKLRMVPLASLASRLHRTVRVTANQQGKQASLVIEGDSVELDKTVLEDMADPLLHILRNAVDHGIEPPALRQAIGKNKRGEIKLRARYEAAQVVIEVSDDGAGIEPDAVRAAAVSEGLLSEADAAGMTDEEICSLLFLPGFSTASEVSEISGRGVGLDIVKEAVHKLKGTVKIKSAPGKGTVFIIRLPMTLAITRVIMVKANGETFAIPLGAVAGILLVERNGIERIGQKSVIRVEGEVYRIVRLGEALELKQPPDETVEKPPALLLNIGDDRIALMVDRIVEGREAVVKPMGSMLQRVHGVIGATLTGDGSAVLILNPSEALSQSSQKAARLKPQIRAAGAQPRRALNILVVDDSVSVRRVLSNLIKATGWNPIAAKDGLEALEVIQNSASLPDIILLDIEMPRMDGYELTATLKANNAYKNIPIVMLTSRAGEKHRSKAIDMGASEYLVKPYQDEILVNAIRRLSQTSKAS